MSVDVHADPVKTDQALTAEIAPAMQKHLRFWGTIHGTNFGFFMFLCLAHLISRLENSEPWDVALLAWLLIGIPGCTWAWRRNAILEQLKYRRVHGKWRWDH